MDELDLKIVDILHHNGRASNAGIARKVGVSEGTIRRRLNRLIGENLIEFRVTAGTNGRERRSQSVVGIQVDPANLGFCAQTGIRVRPGDVRGQHHRIIRPARVG